MRSRAVIALSTVRVSSSNTLAISCCSAWASTPPAAPASWLQARRTWIVLMCFVAFCACNLDRVNMAVAIMPMAAQYGWDTQTVGLVQSSFFWGYLLTQVAGGVWADRYGGKKVLGFGVVWWSIATVLTPFAAQMGLPVLLAARAMMGVGEGVAMPAMNNLLSRWVPVQERSRSLALVYSGMYSGSVLGLALSPHMIHALSWPSVFYVFGALGVVWWLVWENGAASNPAEDPLCTPEERAYVAASTPPSAAPASIPWKKLLTRAPVWALIVSHFCHNWGTFILLTWMPTYYNQVLGEFCFFFSLRSFREESFFFLSSSSACSPGSPWSSRPTSAARSPTRPSRRSLPR